MALFLFPLGGEGGKSSSSKCPCPAQVDFNGDFRVVGLNPGSEFSKSLPFNLEFQAMLIFNL